jgi:hypothetical protein
VKIEIKKGLQISSETLENWSGREDLNLRPHLLTYRNYTILFYDGETLGQRTRRGMSGCFSATGFMLERIELVSAGDSMESQSSWEILSGLCFFIGYQSGDV